MDHLEKQFCNLALKQNLRPARKVYIGKVAVGGDVPVSLQSMTNTNTNDIEATASQAIAIASAGGDIVRITAQGVREVRKLREIRRQIQNKGWEIPLVADIHFSRKAAVEAAAVVEKVRINPGNYSEKRARFTGETHSDETYSQQLRRTEEELLPLLEACRKHNTVLRIGANHGSLSDRIMGRYGDTPKGMVESVMEFTKICKKHGFYDVLISLKSSNTRVMVQANRLLAARMQAEGMVFPLHLGVTEAGEGEDGRIRSAIGIGALLADHIGDTIRVSLSEPPEAEIPVALNLRKHFENKPRSSHTAACCFEPFRYQRRASTGLPGIKHTDHPVIAVGLPQTDSSIPANTDIPAPEFVYSPRLPEKGKPHNSRLIVDAAYWRQEEGTYPLFTLENYAEAPTWSSEINFVQIDGSEVSQETLELLVADSSVVLVVNAGSSVPVNCVRRVFGLLAKYHSQTPVLISAAYPEKAYPDFVIKAAADTGMFFIDGLADGLLLTGPRAVSVADTASVAFSILQASRARTTRTEYIACPSCGRASFNVQNTLSAVRQKTNHLKGLKIAVMGCIVNGPGEMADADYGYVGAAPGKVTLYKGKEIKKQNIPEESAVNELVKLIQEEGDWQEQSGL